ncbi:MAG: hypothetical protein K2K39_00125 [Clostridia bacterium]|nr:hypothetical protein [Clostridia bacterium]
MKVTRYPVILVHGIILKEGHFFKSFGNIEERLRRNGYTVYTAPTDGFGTIENNAAQLKAYVEKILAEEHAEKVNLIAHSKGGLDSICMIKQNGMEDKVASLTTISTPHLGSPIASYILNCPEWILKFISSNIDLCYSILGDKNPNSLEVCRQLQQREKAELIDFSDKVYCQSYSTTLKSEDDDIIMGIPYYFSKHLEQQKDTDGLVSVESSKFEHYRGNCEEDSISHSEIVGITINQEKKDKIVKFYLQMLSELAEMGF